MKRKFFKCARGAVSLLLVVLLLPFTEIATILISAQRYNSSIGVLDEVMDSSILSTLGNYDTYVRERFGLFTVSQKKDIKDTFDSFFNYNKNGIMGNAFNNGLTSSVSGALPLSDNDILKLQIKEYNKLNAPLKMINDGLDLNKLIEKFEKGFNLSDLLNAANAGADICDSGIDFINSQEKLKRLSNKISELKKAYNDAYDRFNQSINDIYNARDQLNQIENKNSTLNSDLDKLFKELESLQEDLENADSKEEKQKIADQIEDLNEKIKDKQKEVNDNNKEKDDVTSQSASLIFAFNSSKTAYINTHGELISKLDAYKKEFKTALEKLQSVAKSTGEFASSAVKACTDTEYKKAKDDNKKIAEKLKKYDDAKVEKDSTYSDLIKKKEDNDQKILKYDIVKGSSEGVNGSSSELSRLVEETEESFNEEEIQRVINGLTEQQLKLNSLEYKYAASHSNGSEYHIGINVVLSSKQLDDLRSFYDKEADKMTVSISDIWEAVKAFFESILKLKLVYDPALCSKIDSQYFMSEFGLQIEHPASNPLITVISDIVTNIATVASVSSDLGEKLKALFNLLKCVADFVVAFGKTIVQFFSNFAYYIKNPSDTLLPYYYTQTLPCRTDFRTGKNMTGDPYSKIEYANYGDDGVTGLPIIQDFASLFNLALDGDKKANDKMFCGAELEYLIAGSNNEIKNQAVVFGMLYILRMICDWPNWSKAFELQALAIGPHYAIIHIMYVLLEPFIDCVLLVNGGKVSLLKDFPYLSSTGMVKLIPELVKIVSSDSNVLQTKFEKIFKVKDADKDALAKQNIAAEKTGYLKDLFSLSYKEYLMLLMLAFSNHSSELDALKNLIQMETLAYNTKFSNGSFDISKAYTQITCEVFGSAKPVLATAFSDSIFKFSRTQTRGY